MTKLNNSTVSKNASPKEVKVIMYNVGFGDCFLLKFIYNSKKTVQVLFDCGTSTEKKEHMNKVIDKLIADCGGKVDAIVVTHRHKDHLSAFNSKDTGKKLDTLRPELVIQPWTEHPDAEKKAIEAPSVFSKGMTKRIQTLGFAQSFVDTLIKNPGRLLAGAGPRIQKQILSIGELNIKNKIAVERLAKMGKKQAYVYSGSKSGLESMLPGVEVFVLGPPTLKQAPDIENMTSWNEDEFWKLYSNFAAADSKNINITRGKSVLFPKADTSAISKAPSFNKWLAKKMDAVQVQNIQQIVRSLDDELNNTSVILLFKIGNKALLFPGDAQLENWTYAFNNTKFKNELKNVILLKVGHHGSTNATPKTVWNIITKTKSKSKPLISLLSTKAGKHSGVPKKSLVDALKNNSILHNTQDLKTKLSEEITVL